MFCAKAFTSLCISGQGSAVFAAGAWDADDGLLDWLTLGLMAFSSSCGNADVATSLVSEAIEKRAISLGLQSVLGKKSAYEHAEEWDRATLCQPSTPNNHRPHRHLILNPSESAHILPAFTVAIASTRFNSLLLNPHRPNLSAS